MIKVFDYKCNKCEHKWEAWIDANADTVQCKSCGSADTTKLPSFSKKRNFNKTPYEEFL